MHSTSMKGRVGVQYLAQGHFSMQMGETEKWTTNLVGGRPLYPSATAPRDQATYLIIPLVSLGRLEPPSFQSTAEGADRLHHREQ